MNLSILESDLLEKVESLQAELLEQCRLNGMGAEREAKLRAELETERLRLAACGVAALGYFDGCKDEYRSASLDDVLRLRAEVEQLKTQLSGQTCYVPPEFQAEMDALRSQLDEAAKQEPVAWCMEIEDWQEILTDVTMYKEPEKAIPLYTKPQPAAIPEGYKLVPIEILDRFPEINPSSYGHDDVCELNAWGVELVLAAAPQPEGMK